MWTSFKDAISLYTALEWDMEKGKVEKEGNNKSQHFCFLSNNKLGAEKYALQKLAYSNILKIIQPKKENFQI